MKSSQYSSIEVEFKKVLPMKKSFKERNLLHIVLLDFLMSYRG
jgi:hypothetical protein